MATRIENAAADRGMFSITEVSSVYSGKRGRCCCGCAGKHTYSEQHQSWAGKNRGYKVSDEEVNDRVVTMMVNKVDRFVRSGQAEDVTMSDSHFGVDVGNRTYVLYFKD